MYRNLPTPASCRPVPKIGITEISDNEVESDTASKLSRVLTVAQFHQTSFRLYVKSEIYFMRIL